MILRLGQAYHEDMNITSTLVRVGACVDDNVQAVAMYTGATVTLGQRFHEFMLSLILASPQILKPVRRGEHDAMIPVHMLV